MHASCQWFKNNEDNSSSNNEDKTLFKILALFFAPFLPTQGKSGTSGHSSSTLTCIYFSFFFFSLFTFTRIPLKTTPVLCNMTGLSWDEFLRDFFKVMIMNEKVNIDLDTKPPELHYPLLYLNLAWQ